MSIGTKNFQPVEAFLRDVAKRVQEYDPAWLDGVVQFHIVGPEGVGQWHILSDPEGGSVRAVPGRHPQPRWTFACTLEIMTDIIAQRFPFRDPKALSLIQISGDASGLREKLGPFLEPTYLSEMTARFRQRELAAQALKLASSVTEVPRLEGFSQERTREAAKTLTPVVFQNGLRDWPIWKWTLPGLIDRCRNVPFFDYRTFRQTTLGEHLQRLLDHPDKDYGAGGLNLPPELGADLRVEDLQPLRTGDFLVWVGGAGALTPAHRDQSDLLNFQIIGRKRWILFSPDQADRLYLKPPVEGFQQSRVDVTAPDGARFPEFKKAKSIELIMNPGDILLNPGGWFHAVEALDIAASVSTKVF